MRKNDSTPFPNDRGYKNILNKKEMFIEFVDSFINESWVKKIDRKHMTRVDKKFVTEEYEEKEADLVYRLTTKDDKQVIFYVLLEMQAKVDFKMPFRLLLYMLRIWLDVLNDTPDAEIERKGFRLPSIVPIVLYNGSNRWTASISFKEILDGYELFGDHVLDFKYILIDINRYTREDLERLSNTISAVFLLDQKITKEEFLERLIVIARIMQNKPLRKIGIFRRWFKKIGLRSFPYETRLNMIGILDKTLDNGKVEEVGYMLRVFEDVMAEGIEKGKADGIKEGKADGIKEGKADVAKNMLLKGLDVPFIAEVTGLTLDQIKGLKIAIEQ